MFVLGEVLLSQEGTTQGDPLAMAMYALVIVPLMKVVHTPDALQIWFADDASAGGRLRALRSWWDKLSSKGPLFGYNANALKTWLLVKQDRLAEAGKIFEGSGVQITTEGRRCLGFVIGTPTFGEEFVGAEVGRWVKEIELLAKIACSYPQTAFAALTHGMVGRWVYLSCTTPGSPPAYLVLQKAIRNILLPAMLSRPSPGDDEWELLALPIRFGGLGIPASVTICREEEKVSQAVTVPWVEKIKSQKFAIGTVLDDVATAKVAAAHSKREAIKCCVANVLEKQPPLL